MLASIVCAATFRQIRPFARSASGSEFLLVDQPQRGCQEQQRHEPRSTSSESKRCESELMIQSSLRSRQGRPWTGWNLRAAFVGCKPGTSLRQSLKVTPILLPKPQTSRGVYYQPTITQIPYFTNSYYSQRTASPPSFTRSRVYSLAFTLNSWSSQSAQSWRDSLRRGKRMRL